MLEGSIRIILHMFRILGMSLLNTQSRFSTCPAFSRNHVMRDARFYCRVLMSKQLDIEHDLT